MAQPMLNPGIRLKGRYIVEALIATGGYATVYKVIDSRYGFPRAMKEVIDPDTGIRHQFWLEATFLANLNHPNIPRGHDHFEEHGRAYLIMDYVEGQDLEQVLAARMRITGMPLDEVQVIRWLLPVCEALETMHSQPIPIIHRDIKPANIKLTAAGVPILIDFGLAKQFVQGPTNQAAQGITPGFAPPEQYLAAGKTDARTDIYGIGATMYTLLTGQEPTEAPNRMLAQSGKSGEGLPPARMLNPKISSMTARIIEKAMDIGAEQRHQTASELKDALMTALAQLEYGRPFIALGESTAPLAPGPGPLMTPVGPNASLYQKKSRGASAVPVPAAAPGATAHGAAIAISAPAEILAPHAQQRPAAEEKLWFNLGGPILKGMGKAGLVLSAIEIYWGLFCAAALTAVVGTDGLRNAPSAVTLGVGAVWVIVVVALTGLLVRAVDRPIARRGHISGLRRGFQGLLLLALWVGMNVAAGMFLNLLSPEIGLVGLGLLALASILNGLLSVANVLA